MSKGINYKSLFTLLVPIIAAIAGFITYQHFYGKADPVTKSDRQPEFNNLLVYPQLKSFSGFNLTNHKGENVTINDFNDQWTLMFFGFTHCPDVCPTTLAELQKTYKLLEKTSLKTLPQVLFVSVDPERDTPQHLKEYINFFNPEFMAATGDDANILALTSQVGVAYHIGDHQQGEKNYSVDHTAAIFVVNPKKQLYGLFRTPHEASQIADDLVLLLEKAS